ncbi:MAG: IclR family transcriptional regulator [Nocardioidaceae bacterium]|nr:IclR family transcriptional regulator [Nocardioidaceae bacterium]
MPGSIQSIERAAAVLHLLGASSGPMSIGEIAVALGLAKPTTHGIVKTLRRVGFVTQDRTSGRYALGRELDQLGSGGIDPHELRSRAMNWTDRLAARTGLTVHVGVLDAAAVRLVHHVFRPDGTAQRLRTGERQPLHATALGKVLLAFAPGARPLTALALDGYTTRTHADLGSMTDEIDAVRRQGHSVDVGEHEPDVAGVAAPVRRLGGLTVGAVGVLGRRDQVLSTSGTPRRGVLEHTVAAARAVSVHLEEAR